MKFVTNTTKEPIRLLHERLSKLNFEVDRQEIFTSLTAAKHLVVQQKLRPKLFLENVATEDFKGAYIQMLDILIT